MPTVNSKAWIVAAAAGLVGCASGGAAPGASPNLRAALECGAESYPATLPSPNLLVDTAALSADIHDLWAAFDTTALEGRHVVLTMAYQTDGLNMQRDILAHDTEPLVADTIQQLVFAHRRQLGESEQEWGVRLLIDLGEDIAYRVEHREYCPPRPRNPELESAMSTYFGSGVRYEGGTRVRTVVMRIQVHPAGYVAGGRIIRGGAAGSTLERELLTYVRQFSFEPATIDGIPAYGVIDVPIQVRS